jgi:hypothetical protein
MRLFAAARELVSDAERRQLRARNSRNSWAKWVLTAIFHPLFYVFHGSYFLIQHFSKIILHVLFFSISAFFISQYLDLQSNQLRANVGVAAIFGIFTVLFALPSTFSNLQLKEEDLDYLAERIKAFATSTEALQNLMTLLALMEESVKDRGNALRWSLASIWALFLFVFNQSLGLMVKLEQGEHIGEVMGTSITTFIFALVLILFPILAIAGYRTANELVFRGLAYACADVLHEYEARESTEKQKQEKGIGHKGPLFRRGLTIRQNRLFLK